MQVHDFINIVQQTFYVHVAKHFVYWQKYLILAVDKTESRILWPLSNHNKNNNF